MCVFVFVLWMFIYLFILFYDRTAKAKEEFNILILFTIKDYEFIRKSYF